MNHHNYNNEPPHHYIQSTWLFLSHAWHGHEHGVTVAMQGIPTGDEVYCSVYACYICKKKICWYNNLTKFSIGHQLIVPEQKSSCKYIKIKHKNDFTFTVRCI